MDESPMTLPRTKKEFQEAMYRTLPQSLTQPCVVRSTVSFVNILFPRILERVHLHFKRFLFFWLSKGYVNITPTIGREDYPMFF